MGTPLSAPVTVPMGTPLSAPVSVPMGTPVSAPVSVPIGSPVSTLMGVPSNPPIPQTPPQTPYPQPTPPPTSFMSINNNANKPIKRPQQGEKIMKDKNGNEINLSNLSTKEVIEVMRKNDI